MPEAVIHRHIEILLVEDSPSDALLTREHDKNVFTMIPHNREQSRRDREQILARMGRIVPGHDCEFSNEQAAAANP